MRARLLGFVVLLVGTASCDDRPRERATPPRTELHPERIPRRMQIELPEEHYLDIVCRAFREAKEEGIGGEPLFVRTAELALEQGGDYVRVTTERWASLGAIEMYIEVNALAHDRMELCGPFVAFLEERAHLEDRARKQAKKAAETEG